MRNWQWISSLLLALTFAVAVTYLAVPTASSQGVILVAKRMVGDLPVEDPNAAQWQQTQPIEVPLSAQIVAKPRWYETKIKSVTARALHNDQQLAILLEWVDLTQDTRALKSEEFRDAAAIEFSLVDGKPFFCMGQQDGEVNIWHWKADWEADLAGFQDLQQVYAGMVWDYYPFSQAEPNVIAAAAQTEPIFITGWGAGSLLSNPERPATSVEDLNAGMFGTLTAQPAEGQNVRGKGVYADGAWRAIFYRDLTSPEADDMQFEVGRFMPIAFAAWDGANGERDGQKSVSSWYFLRLESPASYTAYIAAVLAILVVGGLEFVWLRRRT
ncbi:MAG: ethylbenzene dehydrogenase-related protein [Anaerolineae bacterium]